MSPKRGFAYIHKGKGKGLDTCYTAAYMSQTRDHAALDNLGSGIHTHSLTHSLLRLTS